MVEPRSHIESIICRVAGFCAATERKTVVVSCGHALKEIISSVAYLQLHEFVEITDVTGSDMTGKYSLVVESKFGVVLVAVDSAQMMIKVGRLCAGYQEAGVPVVVITGWNPPVDAKFFSQARRSTTGNLTTAGMFDLAATYCTGGTRGDIFEFGTFQGFTLQCAYHAFNGRKKADDRRFIAFDSFSGVMGVKDGEAYKDGDFSTSEESFKFSNFLAEVPEEKIIIINGPYSKTLDSNADNTRQRIQPVEAAAMVHIDCDVEEPARLALNFVTPYLRQGSLLLFDDYDGHHADNTKGERGALRGWLRENTNFEVEPYRCYHAGARSFIVHKR